MSHCPLNKCPVCDAPWEDSREIPEFLFQEANKNYPTQEKAEEAARMFGWTPDNKMKPGKDVVGIEYPQTNPHHYDGVSEWQCMVCNVRIGKWSGRQLGEEEFEIPFGGK